MCLSGGKAATVTKLAECPDSLGGLWFEAIGRLHSSNFSASVQKKLLDFTRDLNLAPAVLALGT